MSDQLQSGDVAAAQRVIIDEIEKDAEQVSNSFRQGFRQGGIVSDQSRMRMRNDDTITIQCHSVDDRMEKLFSSIQEKLQEKLVEIAKKQAEQLENCKGVKARFKQLEIVE